MNRCSHQHQQQKAALVGLGLGLAASNPDGVVCPKPRRFVNVVNDPVNARNPTRIHHANNQQLEGCESRAGSELLDIMLAKGTYGVGAEKPNFQVASSPPFFNGSPPVRASNPLIQDEQFGIGKMMSPLSPSMGSSASPSSRKNGSGGSSSGLVKCGGNKSAPVRIEGFNCRGISAWVA